ncbi:MAG TPA: FG-GAP-like repeat-containing protein [Mucilaginibacter sp.]
MVKLLQQQNEFETNVTNPYAPTAVLKHLDSLIDNAANRPDLFQLYIKKANALLQLGQEQKAVHILDSLNQIFTPDILQRQVVQKNLALAYLRLGERTNCINNHTAEACIFPISGSGIYTEKNAAEKAIVLYELLLKTNPDDYESRWLLNIAYMNIGGYPEQVPKEYILKANDSDANKSIKPFKEVAMNLGLAVKKMGGGSIADDFNNDGYPDIITSSTSLSEHMHYFRNNKNGTFTDVSESSGLGQFTGGLNMMQTDYNNDGLKEIFVLRGAWKGKFGKEPNSLLRNNGDGTFTDVTEQSGLLSFHPTQTAVWADFNNDGWLDVFIGNESTSDDINPCELYINNKNGTFTEMAAKAGADINMFVKGVTSGDYDNDGRPDIFISTLNGHNILLKNVTEKNGQVKFINVTQQANLSAGNSGTFATWFWDYDNDGWPDILVCGYGNSAPIGHYAGAEALNKYQGTGGKVMLFHNEHNGTFKNVSEQAGFNKISFAMGANFGDIDNDGFLDFYLGTGNPLFTSLIPDKLFKNEGGKKFTDITIPARVGSLQKGHGISFADLDNDGNQDIFINQGGAFTGDAYQNALYINPGQNNNNWINILLEGTKSNKAAIGVRVKIVFIEKGTRRSVYRDVNSGGSFGANPLQQHIGIGKAPIIDSLIITWPASRLIQTFAHVQVNKNIKIKEGVNAYSSYQLKNFNFINLRAGSMHNMPGMNN